MASFNQSIKFCLLKRVVKTIQIFFFFLDVAFFFCLKHKLLGFYYKTGDLDNWFSNYQVSHPWIHDRSTRNSHFTLFEWILRVNHADTGISDDCTCPQIVEVPGFELGSTAWKPGVLTTRLCRGLCSDLGSAFIWPKKCSMTSYSTYKKMYVPGK